MKFIFSLKFFRINVAIYNSYTYFSTLRFCQVTETTFAQSFKVKLGAMLSYYNPFCFIPLSSEISWKQNHTFLLFRLILAGLLNSSFYFIDNDECQHHNGGCQNKCINYEGGYSCECSPGQRLHTDGRTCIGKISYPVFVG